MNESKAKLIVFEKARNFLSFRVSGADSIEEIRLDKFGDMKLAQIEIDSEGLLAVEEITYNTPKDISLFEIVTWETNYTIQHEFTKSIILENLHNSNSAEDLKKADEIAKFWLLEFTEFSRDILRDSIKKILGEQYDEELDLLPRKYPLIVSRPRKYFFPE